MDRNVPSVKLICRSDTDCQYWTYMHHYEDLNILIGFDSMVTTSLGKSSSSQVLKGSHCEDHVIQRDSEGPLLICNLFRCHGKEYTLKIIL